MSDLSYQQLVSTALDVIGASAILTLGVLGYFLRRSLNAIDREIDDMKSKINGCDSREGLIARVVRLENGHLEVDRKIIRIQEELSALYEIVRDTKDQLSKQIYESDLKTSQDLVSIKEDLGRLIGMMSK